MIGATNPLVLCVAGALAALLQADAAAVINCSNWSNRFGQNIEGVCVCNATSCDEFANDYLSLATNQVGVYQTSLAGDRLTYSTLAIEAAADAAADFVIDTTKQFQKIIGFGGAFTDATSINVYKMDTDVQKLITDAYFAKNGLQYTTGRIPIGSTDFSEYIYSYNPVADDMEMEHFSIEVDKTSNTSKLEFIHRALNTSERNITLFASSWAPPPWMTKENSTINCHIKGEEYWAALALYYSKFLEAYKQEGVDIWAITTQNEPIRQAGALKAWQSLRFSQEEERDFLKNHLGPIMKQNHPDLKIIILDDQKDETVRWNASFADPEARQYVSGIGVHWYKNLDFAVEGLGNFQQLAQFYALHPDVFILATEACAGSLIKNLGTGVGVRILEPDVVWKRGEIYARDIINDLANYASGWTDWNLVLDTKGGPNWVDNVVDAPILIDEEGGKEFYKQPMYYIMGHFSKFLTPGSVHVSMSNMTSPFTNVDRVAFLTPDNQLVIVVSNRDATEKTVSFSLTNQARHFRVTLPGNAVQTIVVALGGSIAGGNTSESSTPSPASSSAPASGRRSLALLSVVSVAILAILSC
ncbi:putative glycosyl hydrolase family 30 protein, partial [Globisporangium splendens]